MKWRLIAAGLMVLAASVPASAKTFRLLVLFGQSNAMGEGNGDKLPPEYAHTDPRLFQFRVSLERSGEPNNADHWEPMAPYPHVEPKFDIHRAAFGPGLLISRTVADAHPGDLVGVVKQAMGGTSVVAWEKQLDRPQWHEELVKSNNKNRYRYRLYPNLIHAVKTAAQQAAAIPGVDKVEIDALFYVQTERDCTTGEDNAKQYGPRLEKLIQNVRTDLDKPNLPVVVMDAHSGSWMNITKKSLRQALTQIPRSRLVTTEGLSGYGAVHFDTAGQIELGKRLANAYLELAGEPHAATTGAK